MLHCFAWWRKVSFPASVSVYHSQRASHVLLAVSFMSVIMLGYLVWQAAETKRYRGLFTARPKRSNEPVPDRRWQGVRSAWPNVAAMTPLRSPGLAGFVTTWMEAK